MNLKALLEKIDQFAGQSVGQKPGDQWRGTDKGTPGKKLVGSSESVLKDLSKGPTPKSKEQELAEEYQAFLEAEFKDTVDKRPARKNARPARGHAPQPRYKTIKADEGRVKEKDIELQDYRSMSHKEFQAAYGMTKTEWINKNKALVIQNPKLKQALGLDEAANPSQQAAIAIAMKKDGKKPKQVDESDEGISEDSLMDMIYDILSERPRLGDNAVIKLCKQYVEEDGDTFTNDDIVRIKQLLPSARQDIRQSNLGEAYNATNQHPASRDPIVAQVVKQMRPGLTGLDMGNEAFLYFAYELGKQRARDAWEDYLPAIRAEYEKGLNENKQEDGPVEARWMVKVSDDEGDHLKTYHRKFPSLSAAKKAYKKYEPYASDFKHKPVKKDQVEEAVGQDSFNRAGYNPIRDERDYLKKLSDLSNLSRKPGLDQQMKDQITQRILDLNAEARKKGYIQAESRGHKILTTKLKDIERAKKFASGELKIPTPQERQAQLKQLEKEPKQVKEYGATSTGSPTSTSNDDVKKAMAATSTLKAATGTSQSAPLLMKAMDTISQGKTASATDMQVAQNTLQDINTAFKEPELANQLKPILAKANQLQQKK